MGRTTEAGIIGADHRLHSIQHSGSHLVSVNEMLAHLQNALVHGYSVMPRGNDQVRPTHQPLFVDLVMMEERPPGSFTGSHSFERVGTRERAYMLREDLRIRQQLLHPFHAIEDFNQPRVVIMEGA